MSAEQASSLSILENLKRDAVCGIDISNPKGLQRSFWKELLQHQMNHRDGESRLLLETHRSCKRPKIRTLTISQNIKNLPPGELNALSEYIIDQDILKSTSVALIEPSEEKYAPLNQDPLTGSHILSNSELENLIGDLPSLDEDKGTI